MNIVYAMTHHVYEWILPSVRSLAETNPDANVYILAEDDKLPFKLPMKAKVINALVAAIAGYALYFCGL